MLVQIREFFRSLLLSITKAYGDTEYHEENSLKP